MGDTLRYTTIEVSKYKDPPEQQTQKSFMSFFWNSQSGSAKPNPETNSAPPQKCFTLLNQPVKDLTLHEFPVMKTGENSIRQQSGILSSNERMGA